MDFPKIMLSLFPMFPMFTLFTSETMGPIYFKTSQSLQLTNIVLTPNNYIKIIVMCYTYNVGVEQIFGL